MLKITVPGVESFDDVKQEFVTSTEVALELEHSLVSLSQWESKWERPFLGPTKKTTEETLDYVRCMTLTQDVAPEVYSRLSNENINAIDTYINAKMSGTTVNEVGGKPSGRQVVSAEVIYGWMVAMNIPFECENWHLNRLLTLIRVVNAQNSPGKKMGKADAAARQRELNAARRARYGSSG